MKEAYYFIFYKIFSSCKKYGDYDDPEGSAITLLTIIFSFNLLTILVWVVCIYPELLENMKVELWGVPIYKPIVVILFLIMMALNHALFVRNDNFKEIYKIYDRKNIPFRANFLALLYIFGSFVLFCVSLFLL